MIRLKTIKRYHIVKVNGRPRVFETLTEALKYIAARY